jgi:hypothetical protein
LSTHYFFHNMIHLGKWIVFLQRTFVQISKIYTQPYFTIFFPDRHKIAHQLWVSERYYDIFIKQFLHFFFNNGKNIGMNSLIFCLKGLEPALRGILCWIFFLSKILRSLYDREKTLTNFFMRFRYMFLCSLDNALEIL